MPGLPPWHLWGNTQFFPGLVFPSSDGSELVAPRQLCKIAYGRPESWKFLFSAMVVEGKPSGSTAGVMIVDFDLTVGIGRSQVQLESFEEYQMALVNPGIQFWSTEVVSPRRVTATATSTGVTDTIVAQDIQLNVSLRTGSVAADWSGVTVRVDAYFSPATHLRPEWHLRKGEDTGAAAERFPGDEQKGH